MLDRQLKRVIARVSVATLIIITILVMLAVMLIKSYDIGTQTAYANEGQQTPTPTPTPYWSSSPQRTGATISLNDEPVSSIANVALNTSNTTWAQYGFTAGANVDKDTYYQWVYGQMFGEEWTDDAWPVNGVLQGSPPSTPSSVPLSALWQDNNYPVGSNDSQLTTTITVNVVGVAGIDVKENGAWVDQTGNTITVIAGTDVDFRARPNPTSAQWPSGCPQWGGAASGKSGAEITVIFGSAGEYTVTAGPNTKTVTVRVIAFSYNEYTETSDTLYRYDGGGVNGEVWANKSFHYRAMFNLDSQTTHTHNADPLNIRWDIYDLDGINELMFAGGGKYVAKALDDLGTTRVRFYIDENSDGDYDWWWGGDEPSYSSEFEVKEPTVIHLTAAYAATITSSTAQITNYLQNKLAAALISPTERQHVNDYRAQVTFVLDSVTTFSVTPPVVDTLTTFTFQQRQYIYNAVDADIILIKNLSRQITFGLDGESYGSEILVDLFSADETYAHEIGHKRGLVDLGPSDRQICAFPDCSHPRVVPDDYNMTRLMYHYPVRYGQLYMCQDEASEYEN